MLLYSRLTPFPSLGEAAPFQADGAAKRYRTAEGQTSASSLDAKLALLLYSLLTPFHVLGAAAGFPANSRSKRRGRREEPSTWTEDVFRVSVFALALVDLRVLTP